MNIAEFLTIKKVVIIFLSLLVFRFCVNGVYSATVTSEKCDPKFQEFCQEFNNTCAKFCLLSNDCEPTIKTYCSQLDMNCHNNNLVCEK